MISEEVVVRGTTGLHLAGDLCREAKKFRSSITIDYKDNTANAKSVLSVIATGMEQGEAVTLICEGPDEKEAAEEIRKVLERI
jgi:phosphocarrier protein